MRLRSKLLLIALLLVSAQPAMACLECHADCEWVPPPNIRCRFTMDGCTDGTFTCTGSFAPEAMASQYTVASVEITRPDQPAVIVDETRVAVAEASSLPTPQNKN